MIIFDALVVVSTHAPSSASWGGKAAFMGAFLALILVLISLPRRVTGEALTPTPWWRNLRFYAILIALTQILLYAWWG